MNPLESTKHEEKGMTNVTSMRKKGLEAHKTREGKTIAHQADVPTHYPRISTHGNVSTAPGTVLPKKPIAMKTKVTKTERKMMPKWA